MKVKIGNKIYDSNIEPIMIILDNEEKELIGSMSLNNERFCLFPDDYKYTGETIKEFMTIEGE